MNSERIYGNFTPTQAAFVEEQAHRLGCTPPSLLRKLVDAEMRRHSAALRAERNYHQSQTEVRVAAE